LEFRILGPLEALRDAEKLDLGRPKQRAVLAAPLIHRDQVVSLDRFIDQLCLGRALEIAPRHGAVHFRVRPEKSLACVLEARREPL